jgi:mono/diheme cytochrome c family protein
VAFAKSEQGRDYLIMVLTSGLMGELKVGGVRYNNVMPAQSGLSEADVAAVLSYLASGLGKNEQGAAHAPAYLRTMTGLKSARRARCSGAAAFVLACSAAHAVHVQAAAAEPLGVANSQRAWQNWTLNCQGCHRPDGSGSAGTTPSVAGSVAKFLQAAKGREYLTRVPGVATSALSDDELAEVLNWMLWRFDSQDMPADFTPFTAAEVADFRKRPLRLEASRMRSELLVEAGIAAAP